MKHLYLFIILYFFLPSHAFPGDAQLIKSVKLSLQSLNIDVKTVHVYISRTPDPLINLSISYVITDTVFRQLSELSLVLSIGNAYNTEQRQDIFSTSATVLDKDYRPIGTFLVICSATRDFLLSSPTDDNFFSYRSSWLVLLTNREYFKSIATLMNW